MPKQREPEVQASSPHQGRQSMEQRGGSLISPTCPRAKEERVERLQVTIPTDDLSGPLRKLNRESQNESKRADMHRTRTVATEAIHHANLKTQERHTTVTLPSRRKEEEMAQKQIYAPLKDRPMQAQTVHLRAVTQRITKKTLNKE
jgi:hypothetical protein